MTRVWSSGSPGRSTRKTVSHHHSEGELVRQPFLPKEGYEGLLLQGIHYGQHFKLEEQDDDLLRDLAGNAFNTVALRFGSQSSV